MQALNITQQELTDNRVLLQATFSAEDAAEALAASSRMLSYNFQVTAEDEDKLEEALREKVGAELPSYRLSALLQLLSPFVLNTLDFDTIMDPKPVNVGMPPANAPYTISFSVTRKPFYELSSYEPVELTLPSIEVSDAEVDERLAQVAEENSGFTGIKSKRPVCVGDEIMISIDTVDEKGEKVPGLCADRRFYAVGEKWLSESFDENLDGMEIGETKTFDFQVPGEIPGESPTLTTTVTILEIQTKVVPAITDAWVKENIVDDTINTLEEYKDFLRKQMLNERSAQLDQMKLDFAAAALADRLDCSIPDEMYEFVQGQMVQELTAQAQQQGMTIQQFIKAQGMEEQQFSMMLMMEVRQRIVKNYALDAYFNHFEMEIDNEDVDSVLAEIGRPRRMGPARMREQVEASGQMYAIRESARRMKAAKRAAEEAIVSYAQ